MTVPEFILPPIIKRILEQKQKKDLAPYTNDFEYLEAVVAVESARILTFNLTEKLTGAFFNVDLKWLSNGHHHCKSQTLNVQQMAKWLNDELLKTLEAFRVEQLARMTKKPVLETFLEAMEATENQQRIFRFVVALKTGMTGYSQSYASTSMVHYMPVGMAEAMDESHFGLCQINPNAVNCQMLSDLFQIPVMELFLLANPKSKWVKEQIYKDCKSSVLHGVVRGDTWSTNLFKGVELDLTAFDGVTSEILRGCLLKDEFFKQTPTGKAALKMKAMENGMNDEDTSNMADDVAGSMMKGKEPPKDEFMMEFQKAQAAFGGPLKGNVLEILSMARGEQQKTMGIDEKKVENGMSVAVEAMELEEAGKDSQVGGKYESSESPIEDEFGPYKSDLNYLEDQVRMMEQARLLTQMRNSLKEDKFKEDQDTFRDRQQDEMMGQYYGSRMPTAPKMTDGQREEKKRNIERLSMVMKKFEDRVATRLKASSKEMRLEQLCKALELTKFEKYVVLSLMKTMIMPSRIRDPRYDPCEGYRHGGPFKASVRTLVDDFCTSLEEKMNHRSYFYRSSSLIREGIVRLVQSDFMEDLTLCTVDLDRRMFDFVVGLDTEFSEVVDGSHLYLPTVELEDVVLPAETKQRVIDVVLNFEKTKKKIRELDVQDKISYGLGQVLLFHGRSGTGKTMLANAIAAKAKKKVLLINFPNLPGNHTGAIIKMLFREAVVNNCILFFDECEALFLTRDKGGRSVNQVLTEIEKHDGLCILATNRAVELDEAIHRRVSLAVEFRKPDLIQREAIWKKLQPPKMPIEDDIDFGMMARKFELSGGQIKNCWVSALGMMVQRGADVVKQDYLVQAAKEQIHGQLSMEAFDRSVVPTHGLDALVVSDSVREALNGIVQAKKAQSVLSNWGFDRLHRANVGVSALFTGPPGTGKTMAAEAIGYEIGKPLLVVNVAELVSKWVGETGKNIEGIFNEAKNKEAVLVFDEAEGLFGSRTKGDGSTSRHDNMNVGLLLHYTENFPGICIVITNHKDAIDEAFLRRWRHVVGFSPPGVAERERIWKQMVPKACPLDSCVSFANLASRFELKGGEIRQALMRAASKAALRSDEKKRVIKMDDLETACRQELEKKDQQRLAASMYS